MTDETLTALLDGNRAHVESLPGDYFEAVQEAQLPEVVSVCCSDSRVSQEGMFHVEDPGWLFTPSNIGNQAWDTRDGERVVNGNLLYPVVHTGTDTVAVVGHTSCGAVTAAYQVATGALDPETEPAGIQKWVELLVPVVEEALASGAVDADLDAAAVVNRLVEYNVDRQVEFLRSSEEVSADTAVYGFVYDFQRVYDDVAGRTYLVNYRGETDPEAYRDELPARYAAYARRLLD